MDVVTTYLNFDINIIFYIEIITGYKIVRKVCLFRKLFIDLNDWLAISSKI